MPSPPTPPPPPFTVYRAGFGRFVRLFFICLCMTSYHNEAFLRVCRSVFYTVSFTIQIVLTWGYAAADRKMLEHFMPDPNDPPCNDRSKKLTKDPFEILVLVVSTHIPP